MTDFADNPFLAGVELPPKTIHPPDHPGSQPFGDLATIKAAHPATWWHTLCCWHSSRYRDGMKLMVQDKWGNPDPQNDQTYDSLAEANARAYELNGSDAFCIRQPLPKETR